MQDIRAASGVEEVEEKDSAEIFPDRYLILAVEAWSSHTITTSQFAKLIRKPIIEARDFGQKLSQQTDDMQSVINLSLGDSLVHKEQPRA